PTSRALSDARGVFVTVTLDERDIGRAGFLRARQSLFATALEAATAAVFSDREPTSDPTAEEIRRMRFSLLLPSPLRRMRSASEFSPETQGALVRLELHSAHLLPSEFKPADRAITPEEALEQICLKAQLPRRSYTDPLAELYCFDVVTVDL
ncbi:MAG TPA: AMMECR1 domain-containing protein, partial [candidate division Zixibacteria bacterium]|nr:AMMECR1 domain-containing protein [candidate division Zixibacteria bacterium]